MQCFEWNTLHNEAEVASMSELKCLTDHESGSTKHKVAQLSLHGAFMGRHYSKLVIKFMAKYQGVHDLEGKSMRGE